EGDMGYRKDGILGFKHQVFIEYLTGSDDGVIETGTDALIAGGKEKHIESIRLKLPLPSGSRGGSANRRKLSDASLDIKWPFRLYLRGHGDWKNQSLGDRTAQQVAADVNLLTGSKLEHVILISITGCKLARPAANSTCSFASEFHRVFGEGSDEKK